MPPVENNHCYKPANTYEPPLPDVNHRKNSSNSDAGIKSENLTFSQNKSGYYDHRPLHKLACRFEKPDANPRILQQVEQWLGQIAHIYNYYSAENVLIRNDPTCYPFGLAIDSLMEDVLSEMEQRDCKESRFGADDYLNVKSVVSEYLKQHSFDTEKYNINESLLKHVIKSHMLVPLQKKVISEQISQIKQFQGFDVNRDICHLVIDHYRLINKNENQWIFENEPGYLSGMLEGLIVMLDCYKEKMSASLLEEFHDTCTNDVHGIMRSPQGFSENNFLSLGFRDGNEISHFGLNATNCTNKGVEEFLQRNENNVVECRGIDGLKKVKKELMTGGIQYCLGRDMPIMRGNIEIGVGMQLYSAARTRSETIHDIDNILESFHSAIHRKIKTAVNAFVDNNEVIAEIAQCCQKLNQYHAFYDGNIRTIASLAMNKLLLEHGMSPSVLYNPNVFDGYDTDSLVEEIKKGQNRFEMIRDRV